MSLSCIALIHSCTSFLFLPLGFGIESPAEFDVSSFGGSKAIVLSTMSYLGGKHNFMAISYLVVGIVCLLEGIIFGVLHLSRSRKLGDLTLLNDLN